VRRRKVVPPAATVAAGEVSIGRGRMVYIRRITTGEPDADRVLVYGGWTSGGGAAARSCVSLPAALVGELVDALRAVGG
jgi:hypothetical protein